MRPAGAPEFLLKTFLSDAAVKSLISTIAADCAHPRAHAALLALAQTLLLRHRDRPAFSRKASRVSVSCLALRGSNRLKEAALLVLLLNLSKLQSSASWTASVPQDMMESILMSLTGILQRDARPGSEDYEATRSCYRLTLCILMGLIGVDCMYSPDVARILSQDVAQRIYDAECDIAAGALDTTVSTIVGMLPVLLGQLQNHAQYLLQDDPLNSSDSAGTLKFYFLLIFYSFPNNLFKLKIFKSPVVLATLQQIVSCILGVNSPFVDMNAILEHFFKMLRNVVCDTSCFGSLEDFLRPVCIYFLPLITAVVYRGNPSIRLHGALALEAAIPQITRNIAASSPALVSPDDAADALEHHCDGVMSVEQLGKLSLSRYAIPTIYCLMDDAEISSSIPLQVFHAIMRWAPDCWDCIQGIAPDLADKVIGCLKPQKSSAKKISDQAGFATGSLLLDVHAVAPDELVEWGLMAQACWVVKVAAEQVDDASHVGAAAMPEALNLLCSAIEGVARSVSRYADQSDAVYIRQLFPDSVGNKPRVWPLLGSVLPHVIALAFCGGCGPSPVDAIRVAARIVETFFSDRSLKAFPTLPAQLEIGADKFLLWGAWYQETAANLSGFQVTTLYHALVVGKLLSVAWPTATTDRTDFDLAQQRLAAAIKGRLPGRSKR
eukprot:GHVU01047735.1.p1 GENE.GHVU01047735.1~~GHVU01047735.1.p1  ORF type:complete len:664 (+),score=128.35 GHVU01047735.1:236-2227(+)